MWAITGDTRHADKCVEIFNAWKNITYVNGSGTYPLDAGLYVWKMVETIMCFFLYTFVEFVYPPTGYIGGGVNENPYAKLRSKIMRFQFDCLM